MGPYLVIGAIGVLMLLTTLVVGEVLEGVFDAIGGDLVSGESVAAFLGALGFVGALVYGSSESHGLATAGGLAAGVVVGALAGFVSRSLTRGGDEGTVRTADLAGAHATVISDIPANGYGSVSVVVAGHITRLNARSVKPLSSGTPVVVTEVLSPTSVQVALRD